MSTFIKTSENGADETVQKSYDKITRVITPRLTSPTLMAIDSGLKTGLALYDMTGRLLWYRSHNFGSRVRLKKAAWQILKKTEELVYLVVEGTGPLATIWVKEGKKCGLQVTQVQAERWRKDLLLPRQQRSGKQAKQVADELAREIIYKSAAANPTSLRHDTAEAILVGWWALSSK
jgi:hypothetical protein